MGAKLSRDHNAQMLDELEQKKDRNCKREHYEFGNEKPTFVHRGHMVISTADGNQFKIILADGGDVKRLLGLLRSFRPEVLTIVG